MRYFVTHGQGLNPFVERELSGKFHRNLDHLDIILDEEKFSGKIIFGVKIKDCKNELSQCEANNVTRLLLIELKTVERIFGLLFYEKEISEFCAPGRNALSAVYDLVAAKVVLFSSLMEEWANYLSSTGSNEACENDNRIIEEKEGCKKEKRRKESYSFRVNVKISGKFKTLNHKALTKCIGSALVKNLAKSGKWFINLKRPTVEVSLYLTDEGVICGIPLCRLPLSDRPYLNKIPLRSTIAYCMASLAVEGQDTDEESVMALDPMCGSCTILVELVKNFPHILLAAGIDISGSQADEAFTNVNKSNELSKIMIVVGDSSLCLPFRSEMFFDCVLCDVPFGIQHLSRDEVIMLLPKVFTNINTVTKLGGNVVLLVSLEMSLVCEGILSNLEFSWEILEKYPVKLGELQAIIFHFRVKDRVESHIVKSLT